jgi:RNA polymerase-interacting CarD/CdnL/TRCF family regulator
MEDTNFEVGDKIVRFGRVFEVFKITEEEKEEGKTDDSDSKQSEPREEIIHFRPMYETQANKSLVCAIPVSNIEKTSMRRPMSKEDIEELMELMDEKVEDPLKRFNTRQAKEVMKSNNPKKILLVMKRLAVVRRDPDTNFTYTKKRLFRQGLGRLQEELALVEDLEIDEAREMLKRLLKKQAIKTLPLPEEDEED